MPVDKLVGALLANHDTGPDLVASAAYDLLYAAENPDKAAKLLKEAAKKIGAEALKDGIGTVIGLRIHMDSAHPEDQEPYRKFCENTLGIKVEVPKLTAVQSIIATATGRAGRN